MNETLVWEGYNGMRGYMDPHCTGVPAWSAVQTRITRTAEGFCLQYRANASRLLKVQKARADRFICTDAACQSCSYSGHEVWPRQAPEGTCIKYRFDGQYLGLMQQVGNTYQLCPRPCVSVPKWKVKKFHLVRCSHQARRLGVACREAHLPRASEKAAVKRRAVKGAAVQKGSEATKDNNAGRDAWI